MKTDTKKKIIEFIKNHGQTSPKILSTSFKISNVSTHKHLSNLLHEGSIVRVGKPPSVSYEVKLQPQTADLLNTLINSDNTSQKIKGRLAETKVLSFLIEKGFEVYLPFSNNSKYDVLAIKDGVLKRISVKYTSVQRKSGTWVVEMRQIYRGNHIVNVDKFDYHQYDVIAVYIGPRDKVVLVDAAKSTRLALYLKEE